MWTLIQQAGSLDVNSAYCYVLLCDYFRDTCVVAEIEGSLVGFVSAFVHPSKPGTLFIWQIAVAEDVRGQRIGLRMLEALVDPLIHNPIQYIEVTISPNNHPSRALFTRLAEQYHADMQENQGYPQGWFPLQHAHEEERLFRIGPLGITKK